MDKDKPGAARKGYHWVVRSPENHQLFFHYDKGSGAQYVVVDLLKDFKGSVQSDGYGTYAIYEKKQDVLLLGCWAHARRKLEKWIDLNYRQVLPKSKIGIVLSYTYGIYQRLVRYVLDGRYRIDNNLAEKAVRPLALGRKNYLFCSNHLSAGRSAMIYSLLGTCKRLFIDLINILISSKYAYFLLCNCIY